MKLFLLVFSMMSVFSVAQAEHGEVYCSDMAGTTSLMRTDFEDTFYNLKIKDKEIPLKDGKSKSYSVKKISSKNLNVEGMSAADKADTCANPERTLEEVEIESTVKGKKETNKVTVVCTVIIDC